MFHRSQLTVHMLATTFPNVIPARGPQTMSFGISKSWESGLLAACWAIQVPGPMYQGLSTQADDDSKSWATGALVEKTSKNPSTQVLLGGKSFTKKDLSSWTGNFVRILRVELS